jgi:hypothetical protein
VSSCSPERSPKRVNNENHHAIDVLLQVGVMSMLAGDLVYDSSGVGGGEDFEDDDEDYGEEVMGDAEDLAIGFEEDEDL